MNNYHSWHKLRVIVTGGAGFLGRYVVRQLEDRNVAELIIPRQKQYDLTKIEAVRQLLDDTTVAGRPVDMVIHLAGQVGGIGANQKHQAEYFYQNLMMGVQLLHESYRAGVLKFVSTGTICSYPKHAPIPFREEDLWNGYPEETNAPYGLAKKMLIVQGGIYRRQYGFNAINLLPVNLYGPGDNFDLESSHVIPALIHKCLEARARGIDTIEVWGDGSPTREFLYVEDAAEAIVLASESYNQSEPVNIGSSFEISIRDLVHEIAAVTGFEGQIFWNKERPNGQPRRKLNVDRAKELFDFEAKTPFSEGLQRTVDWYVTNRRDLFADLMSNN